MTSCDSPATGCNSSLFASIERAPGRGKNVILIANRKLEQKAREALEGHPHFHGRSKWIRLCCRDGCLRLGGTLPSWYLKQLAQEAVKNIPGIRRISNHIDVANPSGYSFPATFQEIRSGRRE